MVWGTKGGDQRSWCTVKVRAPGVSYHHTPSGLACVFLNGCIGIAIHSNHSRFFLRGRLWALSGVCVCRALVVRVRRECGLLLVDREASQLPSEGAPGRKSKGNRLSYSLPFTIMTLCKKEEKTKHRLGLRSISDGQLCQLLLRHTRPRLVQDPK